MKKEMKRVSRREFMSRVAERADVPKKLVEKVYDEARAELLDIIGSGQSLLLSGFGRFYSNKRKGHQAQFALDKDGKPKVIPDYVVLKFSAARDVNHTLDELDKKSAE